MLPLLLLVSLAADAEDRPPGWWVGLPVSGVQIVSPGGGVPEESLDPLLRVRQGEPLDPGDLRLDLTTLFHAGEFDAVEADVEPWVTYDDQGDLLEAAIVSFRVYPARRVGKVRVQGAQRLPRRDVLDAAGLSNGEAFYEDVDVPRLVARVEDHYRDNGFLDVQVEVDLYPYESGGGLLSLVPERTRRVEVWIRVSEGVPRTVDHLAFTGSPPIAERRLRRIARKAGIAEGEPFSSEQVTGAQYAIRRALAAPNALFGLRAGGWVEARVTPALTGESGALQLVYHVEPGPRLVLDVDGMWPWPNRKVRTALQIDERLRLTRGFVDDAPDRLETWMQRRGYLVADARVALQEDAGGERRILDVDVVRGPRHHLDPLVSFRLDTLPQQIVFDGNEALSDDRLKTVMIQASEEVVRYGFITLPEAEKGLTAARDLYRANGYQDARLEISRMETRPRVWSLWRVPGLRQLVRPLGVEPGLNVTLYVSVEEKALTRLASLEVHGAMVDDPTITDRLRELTGAPYSPQALDQLARLVVTTHREVGYLEVDARVVSQRRPDGSFDVVIDVRPGPRVLLRSFVIAGTRRTRSEFVRRQVDLTLGEPLTIEATEAMRRDLYELGTFRSVSTALLGDGEQRDLVVDVVERPRWSFELGGGVSTDQGLRGYGRVTRHNLWGLAHRAELFGLVGFDYRSDSLSDWMPDVTDPEWRAATTYTAPRFPGRKWQIVFDLLLREQVQERTWRMARSGVGTAIEARYGDTTLRIGGRTETRRLLEVDPGALLPGEPWFYLRDAEGGVLPSKWREQHLLSAIALHDLRDDPLQPTRGVLFQLTTELSPGVGLGLWDDVLTPDTFVKGEGRVSGYLPAGPLTVHLSGEAGRAFAFGGAVLALEDRYRLGGTGDLRGFKRDAVGPRNEIDQIDLDWPDGLGPIVEETVREHATRWVSTGGDTRALATLEILTPLPVLGLQAFDGYAAALFADIGNVWLLQSTATSELPQYEAIFDPILRVGVGTGLRVATPVGPLQLDVAVNPDAVFARGLRRDLVVRDWEEPWIRGHLSLGTLF